MTLLPKYSSTKASATLLAKRTSPAFVFVHGNDSMRDDSKVFLPILLNSSFKISACSQSGKCGQVSKCLTKELFRL